MKCPKEYKLPTKDWLVPLKILVDQYNVENSDTILFDSKLIESEIKKERVIVKIIKKTSFLKTNEELYNIIKKTPHIVKIYCFINCNEKKNVLTNNYKDTLGFCNGNHHDKDNQLITLEIMRRYESSLNKYNDSLNEKTMIHFLKYLLHIQLELFDTYGFVHNDMHLGNVLIRKLDKQTTTIVFNYDKNKINFDTNIMLYIADFDYSLILFNSINPKISNFLKNKDNRKYDYTLESNIYNTFYHCLNLLKDETLKTKLHHLLKDGKINDYTRDSYYEKTKKNFSAYSSGEKPELNFKNITRILASDIISNLFRLLFKQSFFNNN